ncbi:MAG: GntR family transcriptional regulator [Desulfuromusa sp.]|nr:GntR family transcriptional regulator [Desulfuromusa sp.]
MRKKTSMSIGKVAVKGPLSKRIYRELRRSILEGDFAPGELLPEDFLTEVTGASRTPVREALMHLQGDGLVKIVPRKGARVLEMDPEELNQLVEARILLETAFFDRAMEKISLKKLKKIKDDMARILAEMKSVETTSPFWEKKRKEYLRHVFSFHRNLVEASNNRFLLKYYDMLLDRVIVYSHHTIIKYPIYFLESAKEHENILDAMLSGQNENALKLIKAHLQQLNHRLVGAPFIEV